MTKQEIKTAMISDHFHVHEVFPRELCQSYSQQYLRRLIDERLPAVIDAVRELVDESCFMNNWFWNGSIQQRGFRAANAYYINRQGQRVYFGKHSQHKFGRAADIVPKTMLIPALQQMIIEQAAFFHKLGLRRLEDPADAPTWLHLDLAAFSVMTEIRIFRLEGKGRNIKAA